MLLMRYNAACDIFLIWLRLIGFLFAVAPSAAGADEWFARCFSMLLADSAGKYTLRFKCFIIYEFIASTRF